MLFGVVCVSVCVCAVVCMCVRIHFTSLILFQRAAQKASRSHSPAPTVQPPPYTLDSPIVSLPSSLLLHLLLVLLKSVLV